MKKELETKIAPWGSSPLISTTLIDGIAKPIKILTENTTLTDAKQMNENSLSTCEQFSCCTGLHPLSF